MIANQTSVAEGTKVESSTRGDQTSIVAGVENSARGEIIQVY